MVRTHHSRRSSAGFSLVEVLVASAIISASLLGIITLANKSLLISRQSLSTYQASNLLEEGAEAVRTLRDGGWSNISGLSAGTTYYPVFSTSTNTWSLATSSSSVGAFTRSVTVGSVSRDNSTQDIVSSGGTNDTGTKLVTVTVTWTDTGTTFTKTLKLYLSDILS